MSGKTFKLFADGHDSCGLTGGRWAANRMFKARGIRRCVACLPIAEEESCTEVRPGFAGNFSLRREAQGCLRRAWGFNAADPVESDLLPECNVPKLGVNGVWRSRSLRVRKFVTQAFEDVRRRSKGTVGNQRAFQFVAGLSCAGHVAMVAEAKGLVEMGAAGTLEK